MANDSSFAVTFSREVKWQHVATPEELEAVLTQHHLFEAPLSPVESEWLRAEFDDFQRFYRVRLLWLGWDKNRRGVDIHPVYIWADAHTVVSYVPHPLGVLDRVRRKLSENPEWVASPTRLVYYLLDDLLGTLFSFLDGLNDEIARLEETVFHARRHPGMDQQIFALKREILKARRALASMRDAISQLVRHWTTHQHYDPFYYMELYDHMIRHFDTIDTYRELVNSVLDLHLSTVSNRLNEIVKTLTLVTTALLPASVLAALYGMNFDYLPLSHFRWGFFVILGAVTGVSAVIYWAFRRRDWI